MKRIGNRAAVCGAALSQAEGGRRRRNEPVQLALRRVADDPTHLGHLEELARVQWSEGDCLGLIDTIRRLTSLNPFEPGYHFLRGAALQCLGLFGDALAAYERCAKFGDTGLAADARVAAEELRRWPNEVVARLAEADIGFRYRFERDPEAAWRGLGFQGCGRENQEVPRVAVQAEFPAFHRPS